jgi:hypothetical protein
MWAWDSRRIIRTKITNGITGVTSDWNWICVLSADGRDVVTVTVRMRRP